MKVTLTFDNGPDTSGTTAQVLDELAARSIHACFFVTGEQLARSGATALAERAHREGHWLGNHTYTHSFQFGDRPDRQFVEREIGDTEHLIGSLAHPLRLFRPYGAGGMGDRLLSHEAIGYLVDHGYSLALWNSVPRDWEGDAEWVDRCISDILTRDWSVVVLHDLPTGAMRYLPVFLDQLAEVGAELVQRLPDDCLPIRQGVIASDLSTFTTA